MGAPGNSILISFLINLRTGPEYLRKLKTKHKILKGNYRESFIDIVKFPLKIEKLKLFCILILLILNIKKNDDFK